MIDHAEKAFLSTPSARRATWPCWRSVAARPISIHALREEGDGKESSSPQPSTDFYPRPPRGGRPPKIKNPPMLQTISIHALREEGDPKPDHEWPGIHVISIHALREEGDPGHSAALPTAPRFLSTPSARRATLMALPSLSRMAYFYPRPPRGGRPSWTARKCWA